MSYEISSKCLKRYEPMNVYEKSYFCSFRNFPVLKMLFEPAIFYTIPAVEVADVGLYVQKRGAIQDVHFQKGDDVILDALYLDDRKTDMVRPMRAAYCEYAMFSVFEERFTG
jgi:hypothetical protein